MIPSFSQVLEERVVEQFLNHWQDSIVRSDKTTRPHIELAAKISTRVQSFRHAVYIDINIEREREIHALKRFYHIKIPFQQTLKPQIQITKYIYKNPKFGPFDLPLKIHQCLQWMGPNWFPLLEMRCLWKTNWGEFQI